jgi:hypothetical protein
MFSVALHVSGSRGSSAATPARLPRNCGQFCAGAAAAVAKTTSSAVADLVRLIMGVPIAGILTPQFTCVEASGTVMWQ